MNELQRKLKVSVNFSKLNTITRRKKAAVVQDEMQEVLQSNIFKSVLLELLEDSPYHLGEKSKWKFAKPIEIYTHLMRGQEILSPELDNEIDIIVDDYYSIKNVIGYTYANDPQIYSNTKFFDPRTSKMIGSNWLHEYGHKLGFSHDFFNTKYRWASICYLFNKAYERAHDRIFGSEQSPHDKVLVCTRSWWTLKLIKRCRWK